mmetsp:Transcript_35984/g.73930  ORF Transcript_35984/g.73930 Transcript_35984/m.73930 type:complete len:115 (+) Transcript_35984:3-347(+)
MAWAFDALLRKIDNLILICSTLLHAEPGTAATQTISNDGRERSPNSSRTGLELAALHGMYVELMSGGRLATLLAVPLLLNQFAYRVCQHDDIRVGFLYPAPVLLLHLQRESIIR